MKESEPEESKEDILADLKAWREEYALYVLACYVNLMLRQQIDGKAG